MRFCSPFTQRWAVHNNGSGVGSSFGHLTKLSFSESTVASFHGKPKASMLGIVIEWSRVRQLSRKSFMKPATLHTRAKTWGILLSFFFLQRVDEVGFWRKLDPPSCRKWKSDRRVSEKKERFSPPPLRLASTLLLRLLQPQLSGYKATCQLFQISTLPFLLSFLIEQTSFSLAVWDS